jgi:predicted esterase
MKAGLIAALLLVGCGEGQIVGSSGSAGAQPDSGVPDGGPRSPAADAGGTSSPAQGDTGAHVPPSGQADASGQDATPAQADAGGAHDAGSHDAGSHDAGSDAVVSGNGTFTARPLGSTAAASGFWEYLPPGYGDGTARPLLVFLHGIGENGSGSAGDLEAVLAHGPPQLIAAHQWPGARPFVVLSPQHSGDGCPGSTEVHDFFAFAMSAYAVDPHRIYLTGLSCGAVGSASYLGQYGAQVVVAAVLIAGQASAIWDGQGCALLSKMGLWALHGDADDTVSIDDDNAAMPKFLACPQPRLDVRYTVYPGVGHDSWSQTYDLSAGNDIYSWLLGFTR